MLLRALFIQVKNIIYRFTWKLYFNLTYMAQFLLKKNEKDFTTFQLE
jgi:hypothetical protein